MDRIEVMRAFVRVAELESFTKASENLGLPKASVSNYVQQLESTVGTRLLHRTTRKVQLTQDGLALYEACKDLLANVEDLETMFRKESASITGKIRFDMPSRIAQNVLIPNLYKFMDKYPNIEIELSSTDRKVDLVREGFDCVLRIGTLADSGLIARNIGEYTIVNCVSAEYIKKYGKPKKLEDLSNHYLVHYASILGSKPSGFEYYDGEKYRNLKMKGRVTVNNSEAYFSACLAGHGIAQIPKAGIVQSLKRGELVEVLPGLRAEPMPISIIYANRRNLSNRIQYFMDWVAETMKPYIV